MVWLQRKQWLLACAQPERSLERLLNSAVNNHARNGDEQQKVPESASDRDAKWASETEGFTQVAVFASPPVASS